MSTPADPQAQLFVITGIMAAGKSTVAQALAERFERSVHVRGDTFRRAVVAGRVDMTSDPTEEALAQLRLRYELAALAADRYVEAGFTTVLQDVVIGPLLNEFVGLIQTRPFALVVLAPNAAVVAVREAGRTKIGYRDFGPADMDAAMRADTADLGLWLDTSDLSVPETVDQILEHASSGALIN